MMSPDLLGKIFALSCALMWSFAVILFRQAGQTMKPLILNLYKTVIAAAAILALILLRGIPPVPNHVPPGDWFVLVMSGILGIAVADSLFFAALNILGAGLTAIVDCLYSPMVIGLSWYFLLQPISLEQLGGAIMVISAVLVATLRIESVASPRRALMGVLLGAMAMLTMAYSIILMKPILEREPVIWVAEIRLLAAALVLTGMIAAGRGRLGDFRSLLKRENWKYAFPATILGNVLAMTIWVAAFKFTDVNSAAILNQTNTIFIVILASVLLKEPFTLRRLIATVLAMGGSIMVLIS